MTDDMLEVEAELTAALEDAKHGLQQANALPLGVQFRIARFPRVPVDQLPINMVCDVPDARVLAGPRLGAEDAALMGLLPPPGWAEGEQPGQPAVGEPVDVLVMGYPGAVLLRLPGRVRFAGFAERDGLEVVDVELGGYVMRFPSDALEPCWAPEECPSPSSQQVTWGTQVAQVPAERYAGGGS